MTRRQETSLPPPPPFTVLTHISQIIFPTAWSCFIFLHCLIWFWFVSKWIIVYAFRSLQICSHSEVNLCIFSSGLYIVTHQGCTGPPSGASPCRACSCCAARCRAAPRDADQPEHVHPTKHFLKLGDANSDAYCVSSHNSSHSTVVEELGVEIHSASSLQKGEILNVIPSCHKYHGIIIHPALPCILPSLSEKKLTWAALERLNWSAVMAMEEGCKPIRWL